MHPDHQRLIDLFSGKLDRASAESVEEHLRGCSACRGQADQIRDQIESTTIRHQNVDDADDLSTHIRSLDSTTSRRESSKSLLAELSDADRERLDTTCNRFEKAWRGRTPISLSLLVDEVGDPQVARALFSELVQIDLRYRQRSGESASYDDYRADYPQFGEVLDDLGATGASRNLDATQDLASDSRDADSDNPNQELSRYKRLRFHKRGGLGVVSVALDGELQREVALKEIQPKYAEQEGNRNRFVREATITGRLEHPGVVPVYGLGLHDDGTPYYAMRFIRGDSLKDVCDVIHQTPASDDEGSVARGPTSVDFYSMEFRQLVGRFVDVCNAMEYAHSRGVLHRDLKPANIMLGEYGETLIVDWGLAKMVAGGPEEAIEGDALAEAVTEGTATEMGDIIGTPAFMSPEQAAGRLGDVGPLSDVYSLGATLYYLLTARLAFQARELVQLLEQVERGDFPRPREVESAIPRGLEAVCLRAMAVRPEDRYESPRAMGDDLERYLADEAVLAHSEPLGVRARRWMRKHPKSVAALAATLLMGLLSTIIVVTVVSQKNTELANSNHALELANGVANTKRKEAEEARENADALSGFLLTSFRSPDPDRDGSTVTVAENLKRVLKQLDRGSVKSPLAKANMFYAVSGSLHGLGLFEEALEPASKAYEIRKQKLGDDAEETLQAMGALGIVQRELGQIEEAVQLHTGLHSARRKQGETEVATLLAKDMLASSLLAFGETDRPLGLAETAHAELKKQLGADHANTLRAAMTLGAILLAKGETRRAIDVQQDALVASNISITNDNSVAALISSQALGETYLAAGKTRLALEIQQRAVKQLAKKLGDQHPQTIRSQSALSHAFQSVANRDAIQILERAVGSAEKRFGKANEKTHDLWRQLAVTYSVSGRNRDAVQMLSKLFAVLAPEDDGYKDMLRNMVVGLMRIGEFKKGLPLCKRLVEVETAESGPEHVKTLQALLDLMTCQQATGEFEESFALVRQLRKAITQVDPDKVAADDAIILVGIAGHLKEYTQARELSVKAIRHFERNPLTEKEQHDWFDRAMRSRVLARMKFQLGVAQLELGDAAAAAETGREALSEINNSAKGQQIVSRYDALLGQALTRLGQFKEAESHLLSGFDGLEKNGPASFEAHLAKRTAISLIEVYRGLKKPDEVQKWQGKLIEFLETLVKTQRHASERDKTFDLLAKTQRAAGRRLDVIKTVQRHLALYRAQVGYGGHPNMEALLGNLASAYHDIGDIANAIKISEELLAKMRKSTSEGRNLAAALANTAIYYREMRNYKRAAELLEESLPLIRKHVPNSYDLLWEVTNRLGIAYRSAGNYKKAISTLQQSLQMAREKLGDDKFEVTYATHHLAVAFERDGQYAKAQSHFEAVVATRRKTLKQSHPDLSLAVHNLADFHLRRDQYDKAIEHYEESFKLREEHLGREHKQTIKTLDWMVWAYRYNRDFQRAEVLARDLWQRSHSRYGAHAPLTIKAEFGLGEVLLALRKFKPASSHMRHAIQELEAHPTGQVLTPAFYSQLLAGLYEEWNSPQQAREWHTNCIEKARQCAADNEDNSSIRAWSIARAGYSFLRLEKWKEAEEAARESLKIREKIAPDSWTVSSSRALLGAALSGQGRTAEAGTLLLAGYEVLIQRPERIERRYRFTMIQRSLQWIITNHERAKRDQEADKWRKKLDEWRRSKGG